jgi:hypothetical protein
VLQRPYVPGKFSCGIARLHRADQGHFSGSGLRYFNIGAIDEGDYYGKFNLCNKDMYFKWALVAIYGPAQNP